MCSPKTDIKTLASEKPKDKKCSGKCKECRERKKENESTLIKTISVMIMLLVTNVTLYAQEAAAVAQPSFWDDPFNHPMLPVYMVTSFIFITIVLVAFVGIYLIKVVNLLTVQAEKDRAAKLGIEYKPKPSWWSKFYLKVNNTVPLEEEQTLELDHNYDGIKELDNHLPPWWKWLFIGTVIWGAIYLFVYHISTDLPLQQQEYQNELTYAEEQAIKLAASQPQAAIDENALVFSVDAEILSRGNKVFIINCVACHKNDGGGNAIGPNLTDGYWLHGGEIKNIFATIKNGVVEKGMPAWGKAMSPKDVRDVAFYVMSLQGSNPPNAKEPQGELFIPAPVPADTVKTQASL
jgi:cytochrome c oxidase cbb3-type subunit III